MSRTGSFDTVEYNGVALTMDFVEVDEISFRSHQGGGLFRNVTYGATDVRLRNLNSLAGDTDGDMDVDITDFNALAGNFGDSPVEWTDADFDADNDVDITDFNALAGNFGDYETGPGQVPEPTTIVLCMLGLVGAGMFVRAKRR